MNAEPSSLINRSKKLETKIGKAYQSNEIPVLGYVGLISAYALTFSTLYVCTVSSQKEFRRPRGLDLFLLTVASYKLSRVVTMSFIGSSMRAPFTKRGKSLKGGEVQDKARGRGLQRAVGSLLTCPFCFSVWSATFLVFGYSLALRATRQFSYILTIAAIDDLLHQGYRNLRERST